MDKLVYFEIYCSTCQYCTLQESESPCYECLLYPVNNDSHKPVYWKETK